MKINVRRCIFFTLYIALILFSLYFMPKIDSFRKATQIGSLLIIISVILHLIYNRKLLSPLNIIFFCFILFQFGVPFLYAIDSNYSNFYVEQFSNASLIKNTAFSVVCIEAFAFGLLIPKSKENTSERELRIFIR